MTVLRLLMIGLMFMTLITPLPAAVSVGDEAPDFTLTDTEGNTFTPYSSITPRIHSRSAFIGRAKKSFFFLSFFCPSL